MIELIAGLQQENGVCSYDKLDTECHLGEYKKIVDFIDTEKVESTLSVKDYLVFYLMVKGIYKDGIAEEFVQLFEQLGMGDVPEKTLSTLSKVEKIIVRAVAAYLKKVNCLVCKDLLGVLEPEQQKRIISFLEQYFGKNHCLCILFEKEQAMAEEYVDTVLWI